MSFFVTQMSSSYYPSAIHFSANPKSCDNPEHYNTYISQTCFSDYITGMGVTYIFCHKDDKDDKTENISIMGYITLKSSSLIKRVSEDSPIGSPSIEISELAVDKKFERHKIGSDMIDFAFDVANELRKTILGIQYILICSDPKSVGFYEKKGFKKVSEYFEERIPRENWNQDCIPMLRKFPEIENI
ncbi:MAG: GNAT family N-acetyltransferase [Lachnospiraceae bacterium]